MLNRLPSGTQSFRELVDSLGIAPAEYPHLARYLGMSVRTIFRWRVSDAPLVVRLALWWITPEGISTWDAEAFNQAQLARELVVSLRRDIEGLRALVQRLEATGDFGAANAPTLDGSAKEPRRVEVGPGKQAQGERRTGQERRREPRTPGPWWPRRA